MLVASCGREADTPATNGATATSPRASLPVAERATTDEIPIRRASAGERPLLPPGAVIGADPDYAAPVLTVRSDAAPRRLLVWYRADERSSVFSLESEMQEGAEHVLSGRIRATGELFTVRIAPGPTGGSVATIIVSDR